MAEEQFLNSSNIASLVGQIKAKADETYVSKTDTTYAKQSDITITGITVNGVAVTPTDKVVAIETISTTEVDERITEALGGITKFSLEVVDTLPTADIKNDAIYLVPNGSETSQDVYDEYVYITTGETSDWEKIGTKTLDLTGYVTTEALNTALETKVDKTDVLTEAEITEIVDTAWV